MTLGTLFQRFGATEENDLAPSVVSILPRGTSNIIFSLDLSAYLVDIFLTDQFTDIVWSHARSACQSS